MPDGALCELFGALENDAVRAALLADFAVEINRLGRREQGLIPGMPRPVVEGCLDRLP